MLGTKQQEVVETFRSNLNPKHRTRKQTIKNNTNDTNFKMKKKRNNLMGMIGHHSNLFVEQKTSFPQICGFSTPTNSVQIWPDEYMYFLDRSIQFLFNLARQIFFRPINPVSFQTSTSFL